MTLLSFLSILFLPLKTLDREMILLSTKEPHHCTPVLLNTHRNKGIFYDVGLADFLAQPHALLPCTQHTTAHTPSSLRTSIYKVPSQ